MAAVVRTLGVILAGGLSRRMGGHPKALISLAGIPLLQRVIDRLRPQTDGLLLNINGTESPYHSFGLPMAADDIPGFCGPLAGILCGLDWAADHGYHQIVTVAVDCPFLPFDLTDRLSNARTACQPVSVARSAQQIHHTTALWQLSLRADLRQTLGQEDSRAIRHFLKRYDVAVCDWSTDPVDPFSNINTPEDLADLQRFCAD